MIPTAMTSGDFFIYSPMLDDAVSAPRKRRTLRYSSGYLTPNDYLRADVSEYCYIRVPGNVSFR